MIAFTKRKFMSLPSKKQHKTCAEVIRQVSESSAIKTQQDYLERYNQMREWMGREPLLDADFETLSNTYHDHLQESHWHLQEHCLLTRQTQVDRTTPRSTPWPIAIYLDHIRSAHNVGSILRTTEAFSLGSVYFSEKTPYADHLRVKKTAMGAADWVRCSVANDLKSLPRPLIALETCKEASSLYDFSFPETFTLILGNEEYGCSSKNLNLADFIITIPMRGRKNSLNVANAFAIVAYEISRQKTKKEAQG